AHLPLRRPARTRLPDRAGAHAVPAYRDAGGADGGRARDQPRRPDAIQRLHGERAHPTSLEPGDRPRHGVGRREALPRSARHAPEPLRASLPRLPWRHDAQHPRALRRAADPDVPLDAHAVTGDRVRACLVLALLAAAPAGTSADWNPPLRLKPLILHLEGTMAAHPQAAAAARP